MPADKLSFTRSPHIDRAEHARPYDPVAQRLRSAAHDAPLPVTRVAVTRCLQIYTQDPATPRQNIAVGTVQVPYEPLTPGPNGSVMWVVDTDETPRRKQ